jgi:monoamine oxidase
LKLVSSRINHHPVRGHDWANQGLQIMAEIVIVGGGAAGIGAARRLAALGVEALLIEAGPRLGGRAHTHHLEGMALDLGCAWLHSADRNPWVSIAAERGITVDRREPGWRGQYRDLGFTPEEQEQAHRALDNWMAALGENPPTSDIAADSLPHAPTWHPYIRAIAGFISGADPTQISAQDFAAYDQASTDHNWRLPTGYGALIGTSLPPGTTCQCNVAAERITLEPGGVRLETNAGPLHARAAILTISTAVLAGGRMRLPPALDPWCHAAALLPLGRNEKLFLAVAPEAGLEAETRLIGNPHDPETGTYNIRPFGWTHFTPPFASRTTMPLRRRPAIKGRATTAWPMKSPSQMRLQTRTHPKMYRQAPWAIRKIENLGV